MHDFHKDRPYLTTLRNITRNMFTYADAAEVSCAEIARHGLVGYQTILNLRNGRTVMPRYSTLYGVAAALGFTVEFNRTLGNRQERPVVKRRGKRRRAA